MPIRRGVVAASITELPTLSIGSVTNFNQDRATFNAIVSANYQSTTVAFQYNTTNNFASYTEVTATGSPVTGQAVSVYYNITGLSVGTTYYVRAVISNGIGTVTSSSTSFTTWSLKTYLNSTAGSYSVSVPSITPTGGSAIAPTIYEMLIYGGGGGANYAGGGGGGYRIAATKVSSTAGTQNITGTVGSGGGGGNGGAGLGGAGAGGSSTLVIGNTTYTATGGGAGAHPGSNGAPSGTGGASGSGDNISRAGGSNTYGYYYFTGTYVQVITGYNQMIVGYEQVIVGYEQVCVAFDKNGCAQYGNGNPIYGNGNPIYGNNPNSPIYGNDTNQPIYAYDGAYYAGGGGGGTDAVGANAITQNSNSHNGGAGGTGGGAYGLRGGNGGGGRGTQSTGANGATSGSGPIVGTGGQGWFNAGVAGGATFKYYGP